MSDHTTIAAAYAGGPGQAADLEQRNTQNGALPMQSGTQPAEGASLGEATPPGAFTVMSTPLLTANFVHLILTERALIRIACRCHNWLAGDVPMADHSPNEQLPNGETGTCVLPTAPPWIVPSIPDPPEQKCDAKWQNRIVWVLEQQKRTGKQMVTEMQRNKSYRNPRFMQKHIEEKTVYQYGTCFPPDVWDPKGLPGEDHIERIRKHMKDLDAKVCGVPAADSGQLTLHVP